jgi:hypothetical protein
MGFFFFFFPSSFSLSLLSVAVVEGNKPEGARVSRRWPGVL